MTQAVPATEEQDAVPINGSQPPVEAVINQNGQWFPNQAQLYAMNMNYTGQGWTDYNQMVPNGWMGGYGNMMGKNGYPLLAKTSC